MVRLDLRIAGRERTYIFTYVPAQEKERLVFLRGFTQCLPRQRDIILMGDVNLRTSIPVSYTHLTLPTTPYV